MWCTCFIILYENELLYINIENVIVEFYKKWMGLRVLYVWNIERYVEVNIKDFVKLYYEIK